MKYRPSSLPMLAQCPAWESAPDRGEDDKNRGTLRHLALSGSLQDDPVPLQSLYIDETERVEWAIEYIKCHAPIADYPMHVERHLSILDDDFEVLIAGTPDVTCGPELFDLKWRERNYREQMAAYALAMMQENNWPKVRVHVLYAERKHAEVFEWTYPEAASIVFTVIESTKNNPKPNPCDYCGWCSKRINCSAMVENVNKVISGRSDWTLPTFHASELKDAESMGQALKIARQISEWAEAVEHHAKEMAVKQGIIPTGFKIQNRKGNRVISNVIDAFARAGLPQDEFLAICDIKFSSLVEKTMEINGMKKAQAERTVEDKLGEVIQRKAPSLSLVVDNN